MPSVVSRNGAQRSRPPNWARLKLGLLTACLPAALASSPAGLGLHLGCHPGPGHQTHLHRTEEAGLDISFPGQGQGLFLCPVPLCEGPVGDSRLYSVWRKGLLSLQEPTPPCPTWRLYRVQRGECLGVPPPPHAPQPHRDPTSASAAHASAFLLLLLLRSSSPAALGGLLPHHVDDLVRDAQVLNGAATDVALGHPPELVTILWRGEVLQVGTVHPGQQ